MFLKGSRYENVGEHEITDSGERVHRYKKTRFIPKTEGERSHVVRDGERLDHIAFRYYGDPLRFWRICDANGVMWPDDLLAEPGKSIRIPRAEG